MRSNIYQQFFNIIYKIRFKFKLIVCKRLLLHAGSNLSINPNVSFLFPDKIKLGDECIIYSGVIFNARTNNKVGITLGKKVKIHEYSYLDCYNGSIYFDDFSGCGQHCVIGGHGGLYVGKYTMISGLTYIIPSNHGFARKDIPYIQQQENIKGINIGNNVWIGANCVILAGAEIGDNSIIGAGSVVSKKIPANCLALGVPAKIIRQL